MHEIPVSVHEKVIAELAPAMNQLRDALCEPLPPAGCLDISCFSSWLSDFGTQGEAVADSVEAMGSAMLQWRGQVHTEEILYRACNLVNATRDIAALREPVLDAEFETRTVLLAITDRIFRDILGWYGRYRDVVRHPEAWQGREVELKSHRQNSGWMSSNPILSQFSGWNELHGGFMQRTTARKLAKMGKLIAAHEFCLWLYI